MYLLVLFGIFIYWEGMAWSLSRSLWKKVRRLEKSTPAVLVALVTNYSYDNATQCNSAQWFRCIAIALVPVENLIPRDSGRIFLRRASRACFQPQGAFIDHGILNPSPRIRHSYSLSHNKPGTLVSGIAVWLIWFWEIQFLKICFEGMGCGEIWFEEIQFWDLWFHGMQFGKNKVWGIIVSRNTVSPKKSSEEFVTS